VFSKSAYEGGMQERDLSTMYRRWADICAKGGWERTSRLLGQMAERYKSDAEQEDQRVRIEKRRGG
jgi:hypothetical protein